MKITNTMELPQFSYVTKPDFQDVVEREVVTEIRPGQLHDNISTLQFDFNLAENEYLVMSETYIYVKARVEMTKLDSKAADADDWKTVVPINYLLNTMFQQATVELNGNPITPSTNTFPYKAYLESMLAYSDDARKSHLTASLWNTDDKRKKVIEGGKEFDLMGRIHFDLTHQPRAIPGNVAVSIKLQLHSQQFIFVSETLKPKLKLSDVVLYVRRAIVSNKASIKLHKRQLKLPLPKTYVRAFPIRRGALDEPMEDVCRGRVPKRIFFFMVDSDAFNGSYKTNPFEFKHFGLNYFACYVDGVQFPMQAYKPNMKNGLCAREYIGLIQALNQNSTESFAKISYEDFKSKYFILATTLEPDCFDADTTLTNPPREGTLRIQLGFSEATTTNITGLIYLEFDSELNISPDGLIRGDFTTVQK